MCPSYLATREEKDSTRGRARVLQEALDGDAGRTGWPTRPWSEALDLCLACKGCASDCPTGVDMATYKAEALHQKYAGRLSTLRRPRSHYTLGRLPQWAALAAPVAPALNRMLKLGPVAQAGQARARASTSAARSRRSRRPRCGRARRSTTRRSTAARPTRRDARRVDLGRLVHRPLPAADRATPRSGCSRRPG